MGLEWPKGVVWSQGPRFLSVLDPNISASEYDVNYFRNDFSFSKCDFISRKCFHLRNMLSHGDDFSFPKYFLITNICKRRFHVHFQNVFSFSKCDVISRMCFHSRNMLSHGDEFLFPKCFLIIYKMICRFVPSAESPHTCKSWTVWCPSSACQISLPKNNHG
jgi:hypothetical protein